MSRYIVTLTQERKFKVLFSLNCDTGKYSKDKEVNKQNPDVLITQM